MRRQRLIGLKRPVVSGFRVFRDSGLRDLGGCGVCGIGNRKLPNPEMPDKLQNFNQTSKSGGPKPARPASKPSVLVFGSVHRWVLGFPLSFRVSGKGA